MSSEDFGATTPLIRPSARLEEPSSPGTPPLPPQAPPPRAKRRIPWWVWLLAAGAGFLLLVVIGLVLFFVLLRSPGFTLVVIGAPPGSTVYVDNVRRGVTAADGSIKVEELKAGKRLVRVSHDGYEDFNSTASGQDGGVTRLAAQLSPTTTPAATVETKPASSGEIDFNGPMILIAAGEFVMGDDDHRPEEKPTHKVTLPDYYIDKFEVTNEQYSKFATETRRKLPSNPWWDGQYLKGNPKEPVVGVSWNDASAYAQWAGKRLPTEEEWEKAASWGPSATKKRMWPWGDSPDPGHGNLQSNHPTTVGQSPSGASAYGVQDMAGNAAEWVDAYYQPYPGNTAADSNFGTTNRVVRGGHFKSAYDDARTTRRVYAAPEFTAVEKIERSWLIGFRCAVAADDPKVQEKVRAQSK
jgi:formylglycine-generating enzyme required for sulfatase activity